MKLSTARTTLSSNSFSLILSELFLDDSSHRPSEGVVPPWVKKNVYCSPSAKLVLFFNIPKDIQGISNKHKKLLPYTAYTDTEYQRVTPLPTYTGTYTGKSFNNGVMTRSLRVRIPQKIIVTH
jgi:hypothetical protein